MLLEPAPAFADRVLTRLHRNALKKGMHFRNLPPKSRHQLKIALKKLRYAAEFFQRLYGTMRQQGHTLNVWRDCRATLGHDNDAAMTLPLLSTLVGD